MGTQPKKEQTHISFETIPTMDIHSSIRPKPLNSRRGTGTPRERNPKGPSSPYLWLLLPEADTLERSFKKILNSFTLLEALEGSETSKGTCLQTRNP